MVLKKASIVLLLVLLAVSFVVFGCTNSQGAPEKGASAEENEANEMQEEAGPVTVTDQVGRVVSFTTPPQRIISLSPSITEIVFALGLAERTVGVTEYCNYPPEAQEKEIVGGFSTPNLEKILELAPDLVLASTIQVEEVPMLEEMGIPVVVIEPVTLEEIFSSIALVAEVTSTVDVGEELLQSMKDRIDFVEEKLAKVAEEDRVKIYYEVYSDPLMTGGKKALVNEIINLAGGVNIFAEIDESYPQISAEVVAERMPDMILYPDYHGTAALMEETMAVRPGWENIPAILNSQVFAISDDTFARFGPRVVEAVEEAARLFYPHLFK